MIQKPFTKLALGCVLGLTVCLTSGIAAEKENITQMNDQQKQEFRQEYVENFKRIGLNTAPGDASMLRILIEASNARRGIEVGTATGYGALLMGMAFEFTGGELITIDIDPKMVKTAQQHIQNMGLQDTVSDRRRCPGAAHSGRRI